MDERLIVGVVISAAMAYLLTVVARKTLDAINKLSGGKFYANSWVKSAGIFLDMLLPWIPCLPSGLLCMVLMYYWPPDTLWDSSLLHFMVGCLAGVVASSIYYTITRAIEKRVASVIPTTTTTTTAPVSGTTTTTTSTTDPSSTTTTTTSGQDDPPPPAPTT
jgi:hypothetical protein